MAGTDLLNALHASPKVLYSGQLAATTETTLYTGPTSGSAIVKHGTVSNVTPVHTTLSSALSTGAAITSLPVAALPFALTSGQTVTVVSGGNTQTWTLSANAAAGATTLTVASQTPNFAYPIGSSVDYAGVTVLVSLSVLQAGQTAGTGQHRAIYNYPLAAGDSLSLLDYIGGACIGPSDFITAQASVAAAVDVLLSGVENT